MAACRLMVTFSKAAGAVQNGFSLGGTKSAQWRKDLSASQSLFTYLFEYIDPDIPTQGPDTHPAVEQGILKPQICP